MKRYQGQPRDLCAKTGEAAPIYGDFARHITRRSPLRNGYNFYHQYAQVDFTVLDRRLGTLEELRDLIREAHALDMYVIIDVAPWNSNYDHCQISLRVFKVDRVNPR